MQLVGGYPYWLIKNGLLYSYPLLEENTETNVLIVGGGISGALIAYELVNAGVDCIVADARTIGLGSTCASTSLLQYEIDTALSKLIKRIGEKEAVMAYKLNEAAIRSLERIDQETGCHCFEKKSSVYYATSGSNCKKLIKEYEIRLRNGFSVEWADKGKLLNEYGIKAPGAIISGIAGQIDAYKFTHLLHQSSLKKTARIFDRTKIVDISNLNGMVHAKTDRNFTITAKNIVYANGYEAVNYIEPKLVEVKTTYAIASTQFSAGTTFWKDEALIWNTDDPYLYLRITPDRRILAGGRDEYFSNEFKLEGLIEKKTKQLRKDVKKLFPSIVFEPEFSWSGTFVTTSDGLPFIGALKKHPNNYFALGFGGNGITFGQVASEVIRDMIVNGYSENGKVFSFERPGIKKSKL